MKMPPAQAARLLAAGLCFAALLPMPYAYYTLLRWVVSGVASFTSFESFKAKRFGWAWTFAWVALVFNPFVLVSLTRLFWAPIDIAVGIAFLRVTRAGVMSRSEDKA